MPVTERETEVAEAAQEWRDAVDEAVREAADIHGVDPDLLLDVAFDEDTGEPVGEGVEFLSTLDALVDADPTGDAFGRAVEAAVALFASEHPELRVTEADESEDVETIHGRVLEAKGTGNDGGRVYRVQILKYGTSKNGNRYLESVMRNAAPLYEGAKAFDHHRTQAELQSSTLQGLVGTYRNVEATGDGLYGDLHLMPSQAHVAEALDQTIANQAAGLAPSVGISHDVMANFRAPTQVGGKRVREATAITAVQSADVVADPSAGGRAERQLESTQTTPSGAEQVQESEVQASAQLAAVLQTLSPEQRARALEAAGLGPDGVTESTYPSERVVENTRTTEAGTFSKASTIGRLVLKDKAEQANIDHRIVEAAVGDRFTEADIDNWVSAYKAALAPAERVGLEPRNPVIVTREAVDKRKNALDLMFQGDFQRGYHSFRQAFVDFTGRAPRAFDEDFNRVMLRESYGTGFNSTRTTESMDSTTWAQALGDSVTRQMIREYTLDNLNTWRKVVRIVPVQDFRTQRRIHLGGYGTLPTVLEGGPYQPLTSPGDEEATYAVAKRGGTEDVTLEMIANDDVRSISRIPGKLGRAAARTLYEYVWAFFSGNATYTGDSTAWFHTNHTNTDTSAGLSQTTLSTGRRKMIEQTAYGDTTEVLGIGPKYLIVPPELEELAYQLTQSRVAIPSTPAGPTDTPNIHSAMGLEYILVPSFTDANDWFLLADPNDVPSIELGFYQGREEPELFTQNDQATGSMFDSDRVLWKIRHIYNGTLEDFRGGYRGVG